MGPGVGVRRTRRRRSAVAGYRCLCCRQPVRAVQLCPDCAAGWRGVASNGRWRWAEEGRWRHRAGLTEPPPRAVCFCGRRPWPGQRPRAAEAP